MSLFRRVFIFSIIMVLTGCTAQKPEPIFYGKDKCHHCEMMMTDKRFGAEIVTKKGKVFKFDSIECMEHFKESKENKLDADYKEYFVESQTGELIEKEAAYFFVNPQLRSPMGKGIMTSLSKESLAKEFGHSDQIIRWNELKTKLFQ